MAAPQFALASAAMAGDGALRYWTQLRGSFNHIDAAIEAADPSISRDKFRRQRVQIVKMICADENENGGRESQGFREILDEFMAESLVSLQHVAADAVPSVVASCPDLPDALGALQRHGSERVRGLARDVVREWRASVEDDIVVKNAAVAALNAVLEETSSTAISHVSDGRSGSKTLLNPKEKKDDQPLCPKKVAPLVVRVACANKTTSGPIKTATGAAVSRARTMAAKQAPLKKIPESMMSNKERTASASTASNVTDGRSDKNLPSKQHQAKIQDNRPLTQKMGPVVVGAGHAKPSPMTKNTAPLNTVASSNKMVPSPEQEMKMLESTKRKLREGYQEEADAKRQRKIQVIQAPKTVEHKQKQRRKIHPVMRERSRQRLGTSTAVKRSLISSFDRV